MHKRTTSTVNDEWCVSLATGLVNFTGDFRRNICIGGDLTAFQRRSQSSKANHRTTSLTHTQIRTNVHAVLWKGWARNVMKTHQFDIRSSKEVLFSSIVIRCRLSILTELTSTFARFIIEKRSIVPVDGMRKSHCQHTTRKNIYAKLKWTRRFRLSFSLFASTCYI